MEYVLYDPTNKVYIEDDETNRTTRNLQRAMIVGGNDLANIIILDFPTYVLKLICRPNKDMPWQIVLS